MLRYLRLGAAVLISALLININTVTVLAQYGEGLYGECRYGENCPDDSGVTTTDAESDEPLPTTTTEDSSVPPADIVKTEEKPILTSKPPGEKRRLTSDSFGGELYENIGELAVKVPPAVAYSFPYLLLLLLLILVIRLIRQAQREVAEAEKLKKLLAVEKSLSDEKQNFVMLTSHYLRTPITIIKGNIELMQSLKKITDAMAAQFMQTVEDIFSKVNVILERLNTDKRLASIQLPPAPVTSPGSSLKSPFFFIPVGLVLVLASFTHFIFIDFRVTAPGFIDFAVQILLFAILAQTLFSKLRFQRLHQQDRQHQEKLLNEQRNLDAVRSEFIYEAAEALGMRLNNINELLKNVSNQPEGNTITKAYSQLREIADDFGLVAKLQAMQVKGQASTINSTNLIGQAVGSYSEQIAQKNLALQINSPQLTFRQNNALLLNVLDSVIDNAVKFSPQKGTLSINASQDGANVNFEIKDEGQGIPPDKLQFLFKPFSRTESAETFNTEGMGFSLYLDKLITRYLGGDIDLLSTPGRGTIATITLPSL